MVFLRIPLLSADSFTDLVSKGIDEVYPEAESEKKPILNRTTVTIGVSVLSAVLIVAGYDFMLSKRADCYCY